MSVNQRADLQSLFRPKNIALVGASDKSSFSRTVFYNLTKYGFADRLFLVNRRGANVHGTGTYISCAAIGQPIDLAYLLVPRAGVHDALTDAAAAGARNAVVVASGFSETGDEGLRAEADLVAHAHHLGITFLGPNQLGFANFVDGVAASASARLVHRPGPVAVVSQGGAIAGAMVDYASVAGVGLSYVITIGNEAMVASGDVIDYLVDEPHTRAVAVYLESVREPERFAEAARKALAAGKAIVVLKTGASEISARSAAAHTGSLVGDHRAFAAVCAELGVILVDSIEELVITAATAATVGPIARPGVAIASISGGACGIVGDQAAKRGIPLPPLAPVTSERLRELLPGFGTALNPLDVTGAGLTDQRLFEQAIEVLSKDPDVGIVGVINVLPHVDEGGSWRLQDVAASIGRGIAAASCPVVYIGQASVPVTDYTRATLGRANIDHVIPGLDLAAAALGHLGRWSAEVRRIERGAPAQPAPEIRLPSGLRRSGSLSEYEARELLTHAGVEVCPSALAIDEESAAAAAAQWDGPVALKIVSRDILHKSDVGGVALGVYGEQNVREAYRSVRDAAERIPDALVDGVLVAPMRGGGVELLVGVVRDLHWGLMLAIAVGGVFVEVLGDSVLARAPVGELRTAQLVRSLRGAGLLDGFRNTPAADLPKLARTISRISHLAVALGEELESLEVNPLRVYGSEIEALDAVITWRD